MNELKSNNRTRELTSEEGAKSYLINVLDGLRPLLILGVVAIHVLDYYPKPNDDVVFFIRESLLRSVVPIFFLISGFFFFQNIKEFSLEVYKKKFQSRIKSLVIPYLLWNITAWLFCIATNSVIQPSQDIDKLKSWSAVWEIVWGTVGGMPVYYPFWFIKYLIIIIFFTPLIKFFIDKLSIYFPLAILFVHILLSIISFPHPVIVVYFICFVFGSYFGLKPGNIKYVVGSFLWLPFILTCTIDVIYSNSEYYESIHIINMIVEMFCFINLAFIVKDRFGKNPLSLFKKFTFIIFATHALLVPFYYAQINTIIGAQDASARIIGCLLVFVCVVISSCIIGYLMCRFIPYIYITMIGSR